MLQKEFVHPKKMSIDYVFILMCIPLPVLLPVTSLDKRWLRQFDSRCKTFVTSEKHDDLNVYSLCYTIYSM